MSRYSRSAAERVQGQVQQSRRGSHPKSDPPPWVKPQLAELVKQPPDGPDWFHEIKFDGYRMHVRIHNGDVRLLTRTGLDWTQRYPPIAAALKDLPLETAYLDGELCGVRSDGTTSFGMIQTASDSGNADALVFFLFDLLFFDGQDLTGSPLSERKARLATVMNRVGPPLQYSDHQVGRGPSFYAEACNLGLEGIVSKRADAPYVPGNRGLWVKTKCLNREEFVVVGWTDPEGARPYLGALLLGRFGSPLVLSRMHWVRPELMVEVKFLTWTEEGLLRQVVYQGLREDKPATDVRRPQPR